jgi:hypothetical protein
MGWLVLMDSIIILVGKSCFCGKTRIGSRFYVLNMRSERRMEREHWIEVRGDTVLVGPYAYSVQLVPRYWWMVLPYSLGVANCSSGPIMNE